VQLRDPRKGRGFLRQR